MNIKLSCPVCSYKEIEVDSCPQCNTDISLIRMLQKLPEVEKPIPTKLQFWRLAILLIIIFISMAFGSIACFLFIQPQLITANITPPNSVVIINRPTPKPIHTNTYTVKSGDTLSSISEKLCGQGTPWQVMVQANPQLKGRENDIDVGENFKVPSCKEVNK